MNLYITAIMGQDYELCEEFLDFDTKKNWKCPDKNKKAFEKEPNSFSFTKDNLCVAVLLTLGRDQEAYSFMKYWYAGKVNGSLDPTTDNYKIFLDMPKNDEN